MPRREFEYVNRKQTLFPAPSLTTNVCGKRELQKKYAFPSRLERPNGRRADIYEWHRRDYYLSVCIIHLFMHSMWPLEWLVNIPAKTD